MTEQRLVGPRKSGRPSSPSHKQSRCSATPNRSNKRRVRLWSIGLTVANVGLWLRKRVNEVESESDQFSLLQFFCLLLVATHTLLSTWTTDYRQKSRSTSRFPISFELSLIANLVLLVYWTLCGGIRIWERCKSPISMSMDPSCVMEEARLRFAQTTLILLATSSALVFEGILSLTSNENRRNVFSRSGWFVPSGQMNWLRSEKEWNQ